MYYFVKAYDKLNVLDIIWYDCEAILLWIYSVRCTAYFSLISTRWIFHRIGNPAVTIIYANATVTTCKLYVVIDNLFMRNCMSNI